MKYLITWILMYVCLQASAATYPKREFRGAWIQCVNGQYLGKSPARIRQMLTEQLDVMERAHVNAIMFQVRAECDALYRSSYEPWSRYLTGTQGLTPADGWDPLAWMVEECHKRNMECHAWINPYRAKTKGTTALAPNHVAALHPERTFGYGDLLILNPALKENRDYTCRIVEDILMRYDVDGIHMDDYFYPYPVAGQEIPDEVDFRKSSHGFKDIGDWRRDNVNRLVKQLHKLIHRRKPWVKFGISPFGIYRNSKDGKNSKTGSATAGLQNYDQLYADVVLWQQKGWVDYLIPQIYWNFGTKAADYEVLCRWWNNYCHERPLFIGQDVERTTKEADLRDSRQNQTDAKYALLRQLPHVSGTCQWYAAAFVNNPGNYRALLESKYFRYPALQPEMPFISSKRPARPEHINVETVDGRTYLTWRAPRGSSPLKQAVTYVVYDFGSGERIDLDDASHILAVTRSTHCPLPAHLHGHTLVVTALNRLQNESKGVKVRL